MTTSSCEGPEPPESPGPPAVVLGWSSPDPVGLAGRLRESLGLSSLPAGGGRFLASLRCGALLLRPAPGDERLYVVSWPAAGFPGVGLAGAASRSGPAPDAELIGIGWATVELERVAARFGRLRFGRRVVDATLGAEGLLAEPADGPALVLLEPTREGRLAASLARLGEGPCVVYVAHPGRLPGSQAGGPADGPFGRQAALPSARPWGPHVVACEPSPRPARGDAGTVPSGS